MTIIYNSNVVWFIKNDSQFCQKRVWLKVVMCTEMSITYKSNNKRINKTSPL